MIGNELARGEEQFATGNVAEAEQLFKGVSAASPDYSAALNNLGVIAFDNGDLALAEQRFLNSLYIDPFYSDAISNLADLRKTLGPTVIPGAIGQDGPFLKDKRLAIVNSWGNKFNNIYSDYFSRHNEVRIVKPERRDDLKMATDWADIIWSTWCDHSAVALSQTRLNQTLISHIRSFEILKPDLLKQLNTNNLDGAIFVADHVRTMANHVWRAKLKSVEQTTIFNSVVLDQYPFKKRRPGRNICFVGYVNFKKGMGLLAQCFKQAVKLDSSFRLHIAGDYQDLRTQAYWRHLIKELKIEPYVVHHGWVDNIQALLSDMDYVVSTSPWEGCPNNIIEAMALGIKPLIHNWKGAAQIFPEELIFNSVDQFIQLLLSSDYDSTGYREYVKSQFDASTQLKKIDAFIYSIHQRRQSSNGNRLPETCSSTPGGEAAAKYEPEAEQGAKNSTEPDLEQGNEGFYQKLPDEVEITDNRKLFAINYCRGKRVLHVGCADAGIMERRIAEKNHLHHYLSEVSERLVGIDINEDGVRRLKEIGFEVYRVDIEKDFKLLNKYSRDMDVVVVPEVIEHLGNVGLFLDNLKRCDFDGEVFISTPNAFSYRIINALEQGSELVHPDHVCYFSVTTLKTLLARYGFEVVRLVLYYWNTGDEFSEKYSDLLTKSPYLAEGIIVIARKAKKS